MRSLPRGRSEGFWLAAHRSPVDGSETEEQRLWYQHEVLEYWQDRDFSGMLGGVDDGMWKSLVTVNFWRNATDRGKDALSAKESETYPRLTLLLAYLG